jgi:hypothetical protein
MQVMSFVDRNLIRLKQFWQLIIDDRTKYNLYLKTELSTSRRSLMPLPKTFGFYYVDRMNFRRKTLLEKGKEWYI